MMRSVKIILVMLFAISMSSKAQERSIQEIHSMMVYNFMKYVKWPPTSTSGDFVIGVLAEDKVHETLTKWYGKKSKGAQKIVIKKFGSIAEVTDCHVLYIGKTKGADAEGLLTKMSGKSTLIITNKPGMAKKGSGINFKTINGKLKFELNQAAIASANLKVSSQLSGMAILI